MDKHIKGIVKNVNEVKVVHMRECRGCNVIEGMYKGEKFKVIDCGEGDFSVSYAVDDEYDEENKCELIEVLKYMGYVSDDD